MHRILASSEFMEGRRVCIRPSLGDVIPQDEFSPVLAETARIDVHTDASK